MAPRESQKVQPWAHRTTSVDAGRVPSVHHRCSDGRLFLTTSGNASSNGLSAANEDVFAFRPTRLGNTTSGSFQQPLHFDGSLYGLGPNALTGIQVPL